MIPDHPIKRLWQRNEPHQRVGIEVVRISLDDCRVVIDVYGEKQDTFIEFTPEEWDEIVKAVSAKRLEIQKRRSPFPPSR
jgi:hypothetical protein